MCLARVAEEASAVGREPSAVSLRGSRADPVSCSAPLSPGGAPSTQGLKRIHSPLEAAWGTPLHLVTHGRPAGHVTLPRLRWGWDCLSPEPLLTAVVFSVLRSHRPSPLCSSQRVSWKQPVAPVPGRGTGDMTAGLTAFTSYCPPLPRLVLSCSCLLS